MSKSTTTRTCSACKKTKPATREFFYWHKNNNIFQSQCKLCIIARNTRWQKDNPETCNAKSRKWRKKNIPDWNAYCREWHREHREASHAIQKKWRGKQKRERKLLD